MLKSDLKDEMISKEYLTWTKSATLVQKTTDPACVKTLKGFGIQL